MRIKPVIKDKYKSLDQISEEIYMSGMNEITWTAQPENDNVNCQSSSADGQDEFIITVSEIKEQLDKLLGQLNCLVETPETEFTKANILVRLANIRDELSDHYCELNVSNRMSNNIVAPSIISIPLN